MKNIALAKDYLDRATNRLAAIEVLFERASWADVVRESQEVVELALKGLLRHVHIEVPRVHDVSEVLIQEKVNLPKSIQPELERLCEVSRDLRRDRELSFYGTEDLTPLEFYKKADAIKAKNDAKWVIEKVSQAFK